VWGFFFFPLLDTKDTVIIMLAISGTLAIMGRIYEPDGRLPAGTVQAQCALYRGRACL
jgi:hypothetical protein